MAQPINSDQLKQYDSNIKLYIQQQVQKVQQSVDSIKAQVVTSPAITPYASVQVPVQTLSISPEHITVYEDIQEDYIIYDREIKPNEDKLYKNIVVTGDDRSNRVFFSMYHTFDNRELINKRFSVIWVNANNEKGISSCCDIAVKGENRLTFAWNIPLQATYVAGIIKYAIRISDEDYAWHTLPSEIECVKGLLDSDFDNLEDAQLSPGWVQYIENKYECGIRVMVEDDYNALTVKEDDILYIVKNNDDTITQYLGDKQISNSSVTNGGIQNIVKMSTAEYEKLGDNIDPETLYLLTD